MLSQTYAHSSTQNIYHPLEPFASSLLTNRWQQLDCLQDWGPHNQFLTLSYRSIKPEIVNWSTQAIKHLINHMSSILFSSPSTWSIISITWNDYDQNIEKPKNKKTTDEQTLQLKDIWQA